MGETERQTTDRIRAAVLHWFDGASTDVDAGSAHLQRPNDQQLTTSLFDPPTPTPLVVVVVNIIPIAPACKFLG